MKKLCVIVTFLVTTNVLLSQCATGTCNNGYGYYFYKKGIKYQGQWKNAKRHGHGTYKFENGDQYKGQWKEGAPNGIGTYVWEKTGDRYVGHWKDGKMHGKGKYSWWKKGDYATYDGMWKEGKMVMQPKELHEASEKTNVKASMNGLENATGFNNKKTGNKSLKKVQAREKKSDKKDKKKKG